MEKNGCSPENSPETIPENYPESVPETFPELEPEPEHTFQKSSEPEPECQKRAFRTALILTEDKLNQIPLILQ